MDKWALYEKIHSWWHIDELEAHRLGRVPQSLFFTRIRDVAIADSQRHGRDEMELPRAWTQHLDPRQWRHLLGLDATRVCDFLG